MVVVNTAVVFLIIGYKVPNNPGAVKRLSVSHDSICCMKLETELLNPNTAPI
jgi:hypothetical protein